MLINKKIKVNINKMSYIFVQGYTIYVQNIHIQKIQTITRVEMDTQIKVVMDGETRMKV